MNTPTEVSHAESRILEDPPVLDAHHNITTVTLNKPLSQQYVRASAELMANVVEVTQGETVRDEILGSGDGTAFQSYPLKQTAAHLSALDRSRGCGSGPEHACW